MFDFPSRKKIKLYVYWRINSRWHKDINMKTEIFKWNIVKNVGELFIIAGLERPFQAR